MIQPLDVIFLRSIRWNHQKGGLPREAQRTTWEVRHGFSWCVIRRSPCSFEGFPGVPWISCYFFRMGRDMIEIHAPRQNALGFTTVFTVGFFAPSRWSHSMEGGHHHPAALGDATSPDRGREVWTLPIPFKMISRCIDLLIDYYGLIYYLFNQLICILIIWTFAAVFVDSWVHIYWLNKYRDWTNLYVWLV